MSKVEEVKFNHIKVVINKEKTKVLFAEADNNFTDLLLCFLTLPFRTILQVFEEKNGDKAPVIGSLNTLYKGLSNLHINHFLGESSKKLLIGPTYFDNELSSPRHNRGAHPTSSSSGESYDEVLTDGSSSFIITDDLCVFPIVEGSIIETLSSLGMAIEEMDDMETRNVTFGANEIIALLKESLISSNPLTALIFPQRKKIIATPGRVFSHDQIDHRPALAIQENMFLTVILQKSTNKFLFAQADSDFVDFLFSMMRISLERVEWYLGSNTCIKNMVSSLRSKADDLENMNQKHYEKLMYSYNLCQSYVKGSRSYMVRDDLTVSETSNDSLIKELKISLSDVKEVKLQVGLEESLCILKAALMSTSALTDGLIEPFLKNKK